MKRNITGFICLFLVLVSFDVFSQRTKRNVEYSGFFDTYYWRGPISFVGGVTLPIYNGDLCKQPLDCFSFSPGFSLGLAYKVWPKVFVGGDVQLYNYKGSSNNQESTPTSFANNTIGLHLYGRYYFVDDIVHRHQDVWKKPRKVKPYLTIGLNTMYMKVNTVYGTVVKNGVREFAFGIPLGLGLSFNPSHRVSILTELVGNYCFSDRLDGFDSRYFPNSKYNDVLYQFNIKIQYSPKAPRLRKKQTKFSGPLGDMPGDGTGGNSNQYDSAPTDKAVDTENYNEEPVADPADGWEDKKVPSDSDDNNQYDKTDDGWGNEPAPSEKKEDDGWD